MIERATEWVTTSNCTEVMLVDNSEGKLSDSSIQNYSLIFKYTTLSHDDVPRNFFYDFLINAV